MALWKKSGTSTCTAPMLLIDCPIFQAWSFLCLAPNIPFFPNHPHVWTFSWQWWLISKWRILLLPGTPGILRFEISPSCGISPTSWCILAASWGILPVSWAFFPTGGASFQPVRHSSSQLKHSSCHSIHSSSLLGIYPANKRILPASWGILPASWDILPTSWGILLASWGILPSSRGILPANWDILLASWCIFPASRNVTFFHPTGHSSSQSGHSSSLRDILPRLGPSSSRLLGLLPASRGILPAS